MGKKVAGIVAPSGNVLDMQPIERTCRLFEERGWRTRIGKTLTSQMMRFAGSDRLRARELIKFLETCPLTLCARGGYGVSRILPFLHLDNLTKEGGWLAGFSDITFLNNAIIPTGKRLSLHCPTASILGREDADPFTIEQFFGVLENPSWTLEFPTPSRNLRTQGVLWGGNLSILCAMLGTEYAPLTEGILFIEDVAEPAYKVERNLIQLMDAGCIHTQKAVLVGSFSKMKPSAHDFGYELKDAFAYVQSKTKTPFVFGLPFGHEMKCATLVCGSMSKLRVKDGIASLTMTECPDFSKGEGR